MELEQYSLHIIFIYASLSRRVNNSSFFNAKRYRVAFDSLATQRLSVSLFDVMVKGVFSQD